MPMHYGSIERDTNERRILRVLRRRRTPISTWDLIHAAKVCNVGTHVSGINKQLKGEHVACEPVGKLWYYRLAKGKKKNA